jgi:hypothetical protein
LGVVGLEAAWFKEEGNGRVAGAAGVESKLVEGMLGNCLID